MKPHFIVTIVFGAMVLVSCNSENGRNNHQKIVIESIKEQELALDDVARVKTLMLHGLGEEIVGDVKDICFIDNNMYILDGITASIFIFEANNGKFIKKIAKRGVGPGEYLRPIAMEVDSNHLYLLDAHTNKIHCYDKDLNHKKDIRIPCSSSDFTCVENGFILYNLDHAPNAPKFMVINNKGKFTNGYLINEKDSGQPQWGPGKHCSKTYKEDEVLLADLFSNKIYSYKDGLWGLKYEIDFGEATIPEDINPHSIDIFNQTQYAVNMSFFLVPNMFITSFLKSGKRYYTFFDLTAQTSKTGIVKNYKNDIPFFPQWQHKDRLIGFCRYEDAKNMVDINIISQNPNDIVDDENIVLLFFEIL
jgi:hypothetical protein